MLGVDVDAVVVATQGGDTNTIFAHQRLDLELDALFLSIGVHVRPVDGEGRLALGEGQVGLLFRCGGGVLGDGAVLVGVNKRLQALLGLIRIDGDIALLIQNGAAPALDEASGIHSQALILLKLRGQAGGVLLEGLTRGGDVGELLRSLVSQVGVAEKQLAVGVLRQSVEGAVVGGGIHGGLEQVRGVNLKVTGQRGEPLVSSKVSGPHDVERHDVIVRVSCLQGLHEGFALRVCLASELLEFNLLIRVLGVPCLNDGRDLVSIVLAHGKGDRAAAVTAVRGGGLGASA